MAKTNEQKYAEANGCIELDAPGATRRIAGELRALRCVQRRYQPGSKCKCTRPRPMER